MDPNATYADLKDCDPENRIIAAMVLYSWLARGGFMPSNAVKDGWTKSTLLQELSVIMRNP